MKKQIECYMCKGSRKISALDYPCNYCYGTKILYEYTCQNCGHREEEDRHNGQCRECYADTEIGKYIDNFLYVTEESYSETSIKINKLIKEGYLPMGRPLNNNWVIQAMIKKDILK